MANLIVYYSRRGENYWNGTIKNLAKGNTEVAAAMIQRAVGGDLFALETAKEYPKDYYACIGEAQEELRTHARPALQSLPESIAVDEFNGIRGSFYKNMFAKCPAGRPGTADEVANVAELLMSERGAFITGADFLIDGGATARYFYGPLKLEP